MRTPDFVLIENTTKGHIKPLGLKLGYNHNKFNIYLSDSSKLEYSETGEMIFLVIGTAYDNRHFKELDLRRINSFEDILKYWGSFVFIVYNKLSSTILILAEHSGHIPIFYSTDQGYLIASNRIKLLLELHKNQGEKVKPNFDYILSYINLGNYCSEQTSFKGVSNLMPGWALSYQNLKCQTFSTWPKIISLPKERLETKDDLTPEIVVKKLQNVLTKVVSNYDNIVIDLSGGLDSTSLLFCLHSIIKPGQAIYAVNFFHPNINSSDEQENVDHVCKKLGIKLIRVNAEECPLFSLSESPTPQQKLSTLISRQLLEERVYALFQGSSSTLYLNGHGSDQVFLSFPPMEILVDELCNNGLKAFILKLKELTYYHRASYFKLLGVSIRGILEMLIFRNHSHVWKSNHTPWISNNITDLSKSTFISNFPGKLPGRVQRIKRLSNALSAFDFITRSKKQPVCCPYLSMPIVQLLMTYNSSEFFQNGFDRWPLRNAISNYFGESYVWKTIKGETSGVMQLGLQIHKDKLLELCLTGQLASNGYIDKNEFTKHFTNVMNGYCENQWPLLRLIAVEQYLQNYL